MKIAFLLMCHKNPEQINLLLRALKNPQVDIFVHVDSKNESIRENIEKVKVSTFFQRETALLFNGHCSVR